jgi:predicted HTH domain antitoxin
MAWTTPALLLWVSAMYATNVRNLKRNPSEALRQAEQEPVLILKGNEPNAMILNIKTSLGDISEQLKPALAASLFKDRVLSLGAAAKISGLSLSEFIEHLIHLDIDLVMPDQQTAKELATLDSWLS